jgi:hypothetical protein
LAFTRLKDRVVDALASGIGYSVEQITTEVPEWARQSTVDEAPKPGVRWSPEQGWFQPDPNECPHCGRVLGVSNGVPVCDNCGWTRESDDVAWEDTHTPETQVAADYEAYYDEDIFRGER